MSDEAAAQKWRLPSLKERPLQAAPDLDALATQAHRSGYDAGYAEGIAAGRAAAEATMSEMAALWQAMAAPFAEQNAALLRDLTQLVVRVAHAVVRRELQTAPGDIEAVLEEALSLLASVVQSIDVAVNPQDAALVTELLGQRPEAPAWRVIEDATLLRGGLRIRTPVSYVDASTERALSEIAERLMELAEQAEPPPQAEEAPSPLRQQPPDQSPEPVQQQPPEQSSEPLQQQAPAQSPESPQQQAPEQTLEPAEPAPDPPEQAP